MMLGKQPETGLQRIKVAASLRDASPSSTLGSAPRRVATTVRPKPVRSGASMPMKCQHCEKPATFHITELTGPKPSELHLCEDHARAYLTQSEDEVESPPTLAGVLAQQLKLGQTAQELARLDQRS